MDDDLNHKWSTLIAVKGRSAEVNKRAKSEKSDGKDTEKTGERGRKGDRMSGEKRKEGEGENETQMAAKNH